MHAGHAHVRFQPCPHRKVCRRVCACGLQGMDLKGQKLSEQFCLYTLIIAAVVAFLVGWIAGQFRLTLFTYTAGTLVAVVLAVPDWPWYNRNPLHWQPVRADAASQALSPADTAAANRKARG